MQERIIDIVKKHAKKQNTSLQEIAEAIGISNAELEEKLRKGVLSDELTKSIEDLLGMKEQLRKSSSKYVDLDDNEEKIYAALSQAFADQLIDYCKKNNFQYPSTDLADAINRPRSTVGDWMKRGKLSNLDTVFEVEAILMEGHQKIKKAGEKYLYQVKNRLMKEFMNYFGKTIKWYCAEKGMYVQDFADKLNMGRGTLLGVDSWTPDKQYSSLPSPNTYIKVMYAIKGNAIDEIISPIVNPNKLINGEYATQFSLPQEPIDEESASMACALEELVGKYQTMDDTHKAQFMKSLMQALEPTAEYFRKGNREARETLRKVCRANTIEFMDVLTLARQLLRTEESYQEYINLNKELYGGK